MTTPYYSCIYQPTLDLPSLWLVAAQGQLVVADWQVDKATKPFDDSFVDNYPILLPIDTQSTKSKNTALSAMEKKPNQAGDETQGCYALLHKAVVQLDEYFAHQRQQFDIPLNLSWGTIFQRQVWQALQTIAYGQTISYKQLACQLDKPTAFRACANANGKNPMSLIIPCHRVIASDGRLGGYTGGVVIKKILLAHEQNFH